MSIKKKFHILLSALFLMQFIACTVVMDDEPEAKFDTPEFTINNSIQFTVNYSERFPVEIYWAGSRVAVDWGDGKIEKREASAGDVPALKHDYTKIGVYRVKVWTEEVDYLNLPGLINTYIDFSIGKCPHLEELNIGGMDGLENFDGSGCPQLIKLFMSSIRTLKSVDVSKCPFLETLSCFSMDNLTSLNIKQCRKLTNICIRDSKLNELTFVNNTSLRTLQIGNASLSEIDFRNIPQIGYLEIYNCSKLQAIDLSPLKELADLQCSDNSLSLLDITANTKLQRIDCSNNRLKELRMQGTNYLRAVQVNNNNLGEKALNDIFTALRPVTDFGTNMLCVIDIWGNPGMGACDTNIALKKGWRVRKELGW